MSQLKITGSVKFVTSALPLSNVRVEIWDSSGAIGWIASAFTDVKGNFSLWVPESIADLITAEESTTIPMYRVFKNNTQINPSVSSTIPIGGGLTSDSFSGGGDIIEYSTDPVSISINDNHYDILIADETDRTTPSYLLVEGTVTNANGFPATDVAVNVYEKGFREQTYLTTATLDMNGCYQAKVNFKTIGNSSVLTQRGLFVEIVKDEEVIGNSVTVFWNGSEERLRANVVITDETYTVPSLYTNLVDKITPLVTGVFSDMIDHIADEADNPVVAELKYIAAVTNCDHTHLQYLFFAAKYAHDLSIVSNHDFLFALCRWRNVYSNPMLDTNPEEISTVLNGAITSNIIPSHTQEEIDDFIDVVKAQKVIAVKATLIAGEEYTLGDVLNHIFGGSSAESDTTDFLAHYGEADFEDINEFWTAYSLVDEEKAALAKRGIKLASLTGFQPQMIAHLLSETEDGLYIMAEWDEAEWITHIETASGGLSAPAIPASIVGELTDEEEIKALYAKKLRSLAQDLYPLTAIKVQLADSEVGPGLIEDEDLRNQAKTFIENNPEFDLRVNNIYDIDESIHDLTGVEDVETLQQSLAPFQRLLRVVGGQIDAIVALKADGIDSAQAITNMAPDAFQAAYAVQIGGNAAAAAAYGKATAVAATAINTFFGTWQTVNNPIGIGIGIGVGHGGFPVVGPSPHADPTFSTLFGNLNYCACEQCLSLYSPGAYFTDVLHYLKSTQPGNAYYAELIRRRPDLIKIDITCKNTNTAMPYIDLVNELLENLILKNIHSINTSLLPFIPDSYQTSGTAKEIAATPEHVYKDAATVANVYHWTYEDYLDYNYVYDPITSVTNLSNSVFPNNLPFSLPIEESRSYLKYLGKNRHDLMQLFKPYTTPASPEITDFDIHAEWLGLSHASAVIAAPTSAPLANTWLYYGFSSTTVTNFLDPANAANLLSGSWITLLTNRLDLLIQQLRISYKEFLQFMTTDFLNKKVSGVRKITIQSTDTAQPDTCDLSKLKLHFDTGASDTAFFDKLHRYVRLWRTGKMSVYDWDVVFRTLGITSLNAAELSRAVRALKFAEKLGISFKDLTGWWGYMDTHQYVNYGSDNLDKYPSVYDLAFRNRAVINVPIPDFGDLGDFDPVTGLPTPALPSQYEPFVAQIANASGIKEDDLLFILKFMGITNLATAVTFAPLSRIYTFGRLAKALGYGVKELIQIQRMLGISLPTANNTYTFDQRLDHLQSIMDVIDAIELSPFKLDEILYLVQNLNFNGPYSPAPLNIQIFYESLRADLQELPLFAPVDPNNLTVEEQTLYNQLTNIIYQHYSKEFNVTTEWIQFIFENVPAAATFFAFLIGSYFLVDHLGPLGEHDTTFPNTAVMPALYTRYRACHKVVSFSKKLKLNDFEFQYLFLNPNIIDGFDFGDFPADNTNPLTSPNTSLFLGVLQLARWIDIRDKFQLIEDQLVNLWKSTIMPDPGNYASQALYIAAINENFTTWKNTFVREEWGNIFDDLLGLAVTALIPATATPVATGLLNATFSLDYTISSIQTIRNFWNIIGLTTWCVRGGLKPATVLSVLKRDVLLLDSHQILLAAKGKKTEDGWYTIAKPLRDTLRKKQRDALVGFVLAHPDPTNATNAKKWRNENELYAHLLIDVEMESCMMTSRIKQAISSVQLFMDRVLLGLETVNGNVSSPITISDQNVIFQWRQWRKWYGIWEANRRVFLYPENWIEPELRDNKSVFFEEMETVLMQSDVTSDKVEGAIKDYLRKLKDVAKLEPVGVCDYKDPVSGKIITHAFARSAGDPHQYYYRRLVENEWTGWEVMEIEIKSNHISPLVWNNKLYVFWLTFQEKQVIGNPSTVAQIMSGSPAGNNFNFANAWFYNDNNRQNQETSLEGNNRYITQLEVTVNWTEYKEGKWQDHKVGKEKMNLDLNPVLTAYLGGMFDPALYNFNNSGLRNYYNFLTKERKVPTASLVASRLRLHCLTHPGDNVVLLVQTADHGFNTFSQNGHNLHAFVFVKGADSPVIWDLFSGINFPSPSNTVFMDNKLVSMPTDSGFTSQYGNDDKFYVDNLTNVPGNVYCYIGEGQVPQVPVWFFTGNSLKMRGTKAAILKKSPNGAFKISNKQNVQRNLLENQFFYEDSNNVFFVRVINPKTFPTGTDPVSLAGAGVDAATYYLPGGNAGNTIYGNDIHASGPNLNFKYYFQSFFHAHVDSFIESLNSGGIDGFMKLSVQNPTDTLAFNTKYQPTGIVYNHYPSNNVDFEFTGAYSLYNWELFFHTPLLIAQRLSDNQQFEDAQKWFHYIFDPTCNVDANNVLTGSVKRFWRFRPFYDLAAQPIETLNDLMIHINQAIPQNLAQVHMWENNPFKPHLIARMRIMAYMKNTVMKYLDNLIAWGDQLYRRNTIESINEATQLYILAANILGKRPEEIPKRAETGPQTFTELDAAGLDAFSNAMVAIEHYIDPNSGPLFTNILAGGGVKNVPVKMFYFCLPNNDKLLRYWDTIANRLFNIRNCRSIDGQVQQLPLFEPPIDPGMLVRAAAAGIDVNSLLDNLSSPTMPYRFVTMLQKANEVCNDVKALGGALLSALEKKDAEDLALLRSGLEMSLLDKITALKKTQIDEAAANIEALKQSIPVIQARYDYYNSRPYKIGREEEHNRLLEEANKHQKRSGNYQAIGAILSIIPEFNIQAPFALGPSFGGRELGSLMSALSAKQAVKATIANYKATQAITEAGYIRRSDDWKFQAANALKEIEPIQKQIIVAEIRKSIAEKDLENHMKQIENAKALDDYMHLKYTNKELYSWMISQISTSYFNAYQLAYDIAKRAEKCLTYELPLIKIPGTGFIQFGNWDSLRKGLLSGEGLQYDLRKMELAYLETNKREIEITKHISLASEDPMQLLALRESGSCQIDCTPEMLDLDYPGHYFRRIKSVSVSIPCIAGPYTTIGAMLTQTGQHIYMADNTTNDVNAAATSMIFTSSAQNDNGMFELNFRDERYLPFEGQGAVCSWLLSLMQEETLRQFDYSTISDVIIHVKYTARYDNTKETDTISTLQTMLNSQGATLQRYFSLKHEFSNEWYAYSNAVQAEDPDAAMLIKLDSERFPSIANGKFIHVTDVYVQFKPKAELTASYDVNVWSPDDAVSPVNSGLSGDPLIGSLNITPVIDPHGSHTFSIQWRDTDALPDPAVLDMDSLLDDIYMVVSYKLDTVS